MDKVSIIVPVYNAENFIPKCIESILRQTYREWELILIDDGSRDKSGIICDNFALNDYRIRVLHKQNGGVSSARNEGIANATGDFITFIDADDWVEPDYLMNFFEEVAKADLYIQGYKNSFNNIISEIIGFDLSGVYEDLTIPFVYGSINNLLNIPFCKLFRTKKIRENNLRFDCNTSYGEDHLFVISYLMHCCSIFVSKKCGYIYNHHINSLTRRIIPYKDILYYSNTGKRLISDLVEIKDIKGFEKILNKWYALNIIYAIIFFFKVRERKSSEYKEIPLNSVDKWFPSANLSSNLFRVGFFLPTKVSYRYFQLLCSLRSKFK